MRKTKIWVKLSLIILLLGIIFIGFGAMCSQNKDSDDVGSGSSGDKIGVDEIVYITETGSKYHRSDCQYLWGSKIEITKQEAIKRGYTACSVCNP